MKKQVLILFSVVAFLVVSCGTVQSRYTEENERLLNSDERVVRGVLDNGLSWLVMENHEPENRILLRLVVKAGSVLEDDDQKGIAHLIEHMAFKGTKTFGKEDLVDYFESIGMAFGPEVNAYTSFDETVYKLEIPADDPSMLDRSLQILREWADSVTFPPEELERERAIVTEEWRTGRGANQRVLDREIPYLFQGMPYAARLPIGDPEIIKTISRERIVDFYKDWYRPELMTVVAVGAADSTDLQKKIVDVFSGIPAAETPRPLPVLSAPVKTGRDVLVVRDPELTYTSTQVLWDQKVLNIETLEDYRRMLAENIGFSIFSNRLSEKTIAADPLFLGADAGPWHIIRPKRFSWIWMAPSPQKYTAAFTELFTELERLQQFGVTESELEREKTAMLEKMSKAWQDRDSVLSSVHIDSLVYSVLYKQPYLSLDSRFELYKLLLPEISAAEVSDVMREMYPDRGSLLLITAPEGVDDIPSEEALQQLWTSAGKDRDITAYSEDSLDRPLFPEELASEPGTVVSRQVLSPDGVIQLVLSNGATVVLHPTEFRENEVLFSAFSRGGTSLIEDAAVPSSQVAVNYTELSGLNGFDPVALQKKLSSFSVSVSPWIDESYEGFSGSASRDDTELLFQLINLYFTKPDFTEQGWSSLMTQMRAHAENRRAKPEEQFSDMLKELLYGKNFRFSNLTEEIVSKMDRDVAERVYRERFSGADDFVFVFTGSFSEDEITGFAEKYLAVLPAAGKAEEAVPIRPPFPDGILCKSLKSGLEPKSVVFIGFGGNETLEDLDYELFDQFRSLLDLRLREAIRETLGGSYGVWIGGVRSGYPEGRFSLQIQFGCAPGREEELTEAVIATMSDLREGAIQEEDLVKLREQYRRGIESGLQNNQYWHSALVRTLMRGQSPRIITDTERVLSRITGETLRDQVRRYIDPENYVCGWLVPAEKTAESVAP